ncbi:Hypothetical predicted protein, partial [Marmota monax]
ESWLKQRIPVTGTLSLEVEQRVDVLILFRWRNLTLLDRSGGWPRQREEGKAVTEGTLCRL